MIRHVAVFLTAGWFAMAVPGWSADRAQAAPRGIKASSESFDRKVARHRAEELSDAVEYFQELVEWALVLRSETIAFSVRLESGDAVQPLSGAELERLRQGMVEHLALRDEVLKLVESYSAWVESRTPVPDEGLRCKGVMLSLAGALVLYDNFSHAIEAVLENSRLRRIANRPDPSFDLGANELFEAMRRYYSPTDRARVRRAIEFSRVQAELIDEQAVRDPQIAYLQLLIDESPSKRRLFDDSLWDRLVSAIKGTQIQSADSVDSLRVETTQTILGTLIGNDGEASPHRGQLIPTPALVASLESELEPLDVLLDKSRWRLLDKVIPGYFTHVGIWLGTERQLRRSGLWEHPVVEPHRADIRAGKVILEAVRVGVRLIDLGTFLNLDDLALLRPRSFDRTERSAALVRAFSQIGKEYDFNFDVETTDRMVCSEIPYAVFTRVPWPTETLVGRATISPDNIALQALSDGPFELYRFYRNGIEVESGRQTAFRAVLER